MRGFILALLLAATTGQPLLAVPVVCTMAGQQKVMSCASCCQYHCCCAANAQTKAQSVSILAQTVAKDQIGFPAPAFSAACFADFSRCDRAGAVLLGATSHAPPPLAVGCIRLI